jgi:hypothetical protein
VHCCKAGANWTIVGTVLNRRYTDGSAPPWLQARCARFSGYTQSIVQDAFFPEWSKNADIQFDSANELIRAPQRAQRISEQFKPDDHSELVPLLPIPNRTVKRLSADDSADSRVKVGHRQATSSPLQRTIFSPCASGGFGICAGLRQQPAGREPGAGCLSCEALGGRGGA